MLFVPAFTPLTFHWNDGVDPPPAITVAVKVTDVPAQTGFADGAMDTAAVGFGVIVRRTEFEVAGFPELQVALDVTTQVIVSLTTGTKV